MAPCKWRRVQAPAVGNFLNANSRIRVADVSSNANRDFFLDYIAVNVIYVP